MTEKESTNTTFVMNLFGLFIAASYIRSVGPSLAQANQFGTQNPSHTFDEFVVPP
jgi:hypothetical protein